MQSADDNNWMLVESISGQYQCIQISDFKKCKTLSVTKRCCYRTSTNYMFGFMINDYEVLLVKTIVEVNALAKNGERTKKERDAASAIPLDALLKDDTQVMIFERTEGNGDYEFTKITPKQIE